MNIEYIIYKKLTYDFKVITVKYKYYKNTYYFVSMPHLLSFKNLYYLNDFV